MTAVPALDSATAYVTVVRGDTTAGAASGGLTMDYDDLIKRLKECSTYGFKQEICGEAATALSTLQDETAQLRRRHSEAVSVCSRIAEWAQNTGHDYVEGIAKEFLEGDG